MKRVRDQQRPKEQAAFLRVQGSTKRYKNIDITMTADTDGHVQPFIQIERADGTPLERGEQNGGIAFILIWLKWLLLTGLEESKKGGGENDA